MVQKALTYKATIHCLKSMLFYQLTLLSNNHVLMSYLTGIYFESWFSWLREGVRKHWKKKKTDRRKRLKKKRKTKPMNTKKLNNNNNKHLRFYLWIYFAWKHSSKKAVYTIIFYLQFLCVAGYLKRSSHTPKVNIHKYTNYNI